MFSKFSSVSDFVSDFVYNSERQGKELSPIVTLEDREPDPEVMQLSEIGESA